MNRKENNQDKIIVSQIEKEIKEKFLNYAMSVIVSRALPLVKDGLKPVHRRILYAMHGLKMFPKSKYKKSARVVGEVIGKYHPHGDNAVYEAMTKMVQDFYCNHPLIDGHGNFGSIDGDSPAAMRYTEVRLSPLAGEILADLEYNTVDFAPNYDDSEKEPVVLPGLVPTLLINGSTGIAVGMATSIPPHNLEEVLNVIIAYLKNPDLTIEEIVEKGLILGPDFPTGAFLIIQKQQLIKNLKTGRGTYLIRSAYHVEKGDKDNQQIIIDQIPYQVNKTKILEIIVDLIKKKKLLNIADLRDESNRLGIRIVIDLKKDAQVDIVLNQLFKYTPLQTSFSMNLLTLYNNQPQVMSFLDVIKYYSKHQIEVLLRKTTFLLKKDQQELEILLGKNKAITKIDAVIEIIKKAKNSSEAAPKLEKLLEINSIQSEAILKLTLQSLTGLEREKIKTKIINLEIAIKEYQKILSDQKYQKRILIKKSKELSKKYARPRLTKILEEDQFSGLTDEDLILHEEVLVCLTKNNYLKRVSLNYFRQQKRGGVGIKGISLNEGDQIKQILKVDTHDNLLFFTNLGKVYQLKTWKIPSLGRVAKGTPAQNLININTENEKIESIIHISSFYTADNDLFFVTKKGIVKKTNLNLFAKINKNGKVAIKLNDKDLLKTVFPVKDDTTIIIGKSDNKICRFNTSAIPSLGRATKGVIGTKINHPNSFVTGASFATPGQKILTISNDGKGKLNPLEKYRITNRGTLGVLAVNNKLHDKKLVTSLAVNGDETLLIAKSSGKFILIPLKETRIIKNRSARGVKLVNLDDQEIIMAVNIF